MSDHETTIDVIDAVAKITDAEPVMLESTTDLKPKLKVKGTVKKLELYGAFVDLGLDVNALIHISQLGKKRVNHVSDVLQEGDEVVAWVERVDLDNNQVSLTMIQPRPLDWHEMKAGQAYAGTVIRLEKFGAFVDIGAEKEGLVHVSELSHEYVKDPSQIVRVGDRINVQVLSFNKRKRRIDLSAKALLNEPEAEPIEDMIGEVEEEEVELQTAMEIALRRALGKEPNSEDRSASARRGRRRKEKLRRQQEDILSRTLSHDIE